MMKIFLRASASVFAVAAFAAALGVPSAFATETSLCKVEAEVCPAASQYPSETEVKASTSGKEEGGSSAQLVTSIGIVVCTSSITLKTQAATASPLPAILTALTWSSCKLVGGEAPTCTVTSVNLSYKASLGWIAHNRATLTLVSGTGGKPGFTIVCGSVINCTFAKENAELEFAGGTAGTAKVTADNVVLAKNSGSKCPASASWSGVYSISTPNPAQVSK